MGRPRIHRAPQPGDKCGLWTVLESGLKSGGENAVRAACECGAEKLVLESNLRRRSPSCWNCAAKRKSVPRHVGNPLERPGLRERFWRKVDVGAKDDCWDWKTAIRCGYGAFCVNGSNMVASRVAWELTHGAIPEGLSVLHSCDRPKCCNPSHLFLGTQADNVADRDAKGRGANQFGRWGHQPR